MDRSSLHKIAPEVLLLMEDLTPAPLAPSALPGTEARAPTVTPPEKTVVFVQFQGDLAPIQALGFRLLSQNGTIAIGEIALGDLPALAAHPNVIRIDKPEPPSLLDHSYTDIRADQVWGVSNGVFSGFTGGLLSLVGIIDSGIEYTHGAFRRPDGTSRILAIWDQTLTPAAGESSPGPLAHPVLGPAALGYGVEYKDQDNNPAVPTLARALSNANPFSIVRHRDTLGHGTHVAGITAGNGSQNGNCHGAYHYIGVAPEAGFIIVRMRGLTPGDPPPTGTEISDALRYIIDRASSQFVGTHVRPVAINMSFGSSTGARDGTGGQEVATDQIQAAFPNGVVIVNAAGNDGENKMHAVGTVAGGGFLNLNFTVGPNTQQQVGIDVRYSVGTLDGAVQPPNGALSGFAVPVARLPVPLAGGGTATLIAAANALLLRVTPPPGGSVLAGPWVLRLRAHAGPAVPFDAWADSAQFPDSISTSATTISSNASAANVITVGAHKAKGRDAGKLAPFSSLGPSMRPPSAADPNLNIRPHLTAPGVKVTAPAIEKYRHDNDCDACLCCCCADWYRDDDGTSMAAPHVTGAAAVILDQSSTLSFSEVRNILINSARHDGFTGVTPNNSFGWGKLDLKAAVDAATSGPHPQIAPREVAVASRDVLPSPSGAKERGRRGLLDAATPVGRFLQTPQGRELYRLGQRHLAELRELVNTNKRVATVWHRQHGPLVSHHAIRCYMMPQARMPLEVEGQPIQAGLERMAAILRRYGSPQMRADLDFALRLMSALPGKNLEEAIALLQTKSSSVHA
jgi:subtilisin family serine protease